jgi:hypothetical protein
MLKDFSSIHARHGKLRLIPTPFQQYTFSAEDLEDLGEIGRGAFGTVNKMLHRESKKEMAVKVSPFSFSIKPTMI